MKDSTPKRKMGEIALSARIRNIFFRNQAEMLNTLMPWWAAFTLVGCVTCLYPNVPDIWMGWSDAWQTGVRLCTWLLISESLVNWWLLRTTRSFFRASQWDEAETRRMCDASDAQAVNVENSRNKALPTDELHDDIMAPLGDTKLFAVYVPEADGSKRVMMYPYFTWRPCITCNTYRPPRAHHCPLCRRCVLKRDHHCFFAGSCVGLHNQRFFITFTFWAALLATFGLVNASLYSYSQLEWDRWDLLLPIVFFRWWLGYISIVKFMIILLLCSLLFLSPATSILCYEGLKIICHGRTTFEMDNDVKLVDTRSTLQRLRTALGEYWWLSFVLPTHCWFPVQEDGVHWPSIKHIDS